MRFVDLTAAQILDALSIEFPELLTVEQRVRAQVPIYKREIERYQAAALYALATEVNYPGARILEIGTAQGYSAAYLAEAAPEATIITLNPKDGESEQAARNLSAWRNVTVVKQTSAEYLATLVPEDRFDLIFVDGDHGRVAADLPYWDHLNVGGLMVFHDYAPAASGRPCPPVYDVLNQVRAALARPFDVEVVDNRAVGLVGFARGANEAWAQLGVPADYAPWSVQYEPVKRWVRHGE